jgi:hypothetical protein
MERAGKNNIASMIKKPLRIWFSWGNAQNKLQDAKPDPAASCDPAADPESIGAESVDVEGTLVTC